ncbi:MULTISPECIES: DoxX family protein [unclassified Capnocytophaga]|jgi:doxX family protein|uniref:DoxX family protein n=1 Tax=unclassified Capnocytophaga TaxID=2640652 RepID=UPI000202FBB3|nr:MULTISPECIES: DoxX family protein [unclassified Capnocytophaga]EGD33725.1 DoxX protein [Capnocytophaga sp. oral taxon 338 str. F0234]MEB3004551.1 DoxX family protein [Capnocytophaga sp. G2]
MYYYHETTHKQNGNWGILLLRIFIGGILLFHGISKFNDISFVKIQLVNNGLPSIWAYGIYIGEIIAPLLVILGYRTRFFSMLIAINCLVATLLVHRGEIFIVDPNTGAWGIETLGLFFGGAISLCFLGGGKYALSKRSSWD